MIFVSVALFMALAVIAYQQWSFARTMERERVATAAERRELLQRIQDPVSANAVQAQESLDISLPRHFVEFDDDADFDTARQMLDN